MGKKKAMKKTKELSVAIAESSSLDAEGQPQQVLTPRKRGRPRKIIVEKTEAEELQVKEEEAAGKEGHEEDIEGNQSKYVKISSAEKEEEKGEGSQGTTTSSKIKEEGTTSSRRQLSTRSRAKRKSKPRKSS